MTIGMTANGQYITLDNETDSVIYARTDNYIYLSFALLGQWKDCANVYATFEDGDHKESEKTDITARLADGMVEVPPNLMGGRNVLTVKLTGTDPDKGMVITSDRRSFIVRDAGGVTGLTGQPFDETTLDEFYKMLDSKVSTFEIADTITGEPGTDASVANIGTPQDVRLQFTIPEGLKGDTGETPNINISATVDDKVGTPAVRVDRTGTPEAPNFLLAFSNMKGETGATPDIQATATIDDRVGTPAVQVTRSGTAEDPTLAFSFSNMKGEKGDTGDRGPIGPTPDVSASATVGGNIGTPTVQVERSGTAEDPSFLFEFDGLKGERGEKGADANMYGFAIDPADGHLKLLYDDGANTPTFSMTADGHLVSTITAS